MNQNSLILQKLRGNLVVSCQALEDEPLHGAMIMGRMALAAQMGGAAGIRANSVEDICEIRRQVDLPLIGIIKKEYDDSEIYITPTMKEITALLATPAEIVGMDATKRLRPSGTPLRELLDAVKRAGKLALADVSDLEEGAAAEAMGFDIVSTTLSGYTPYTLGRRKPDISLVRELALRLKIPVAAEGNIRNPEELIECLRQGAAFAIIGGAITRPQNITRTFVGAIAKWRGEERDESVCCR